MQAFFWKKKNDWFELCHESDLIGEWLKWAISFSLEGNEVWKVHSSQIKLKYNVQHFEYKVMMLNHLYTSGLALTLNSTGFGCFCVSDASQLRS